MFQTMFKLGQDKKHVAIFLVVFVNFGGTVETKFTRIETMIFIIYSPFFPLRPSLSPPFSLYLFLFFQHNKGWLPVKWTAYESLLYGQYTTKSDV